MENITILNSVFLESSKYLFYKCLVLLGIGLVFLWYILVILAVITEINFKSCCKKYSVDFMTVFRNLTKGVDPSFFRMQGNGVKNLRL